MKINAARVTWTMQKRSCQGYFKLLDITTPGESAKFNQCNLLIVSLGG